MILKCAIFGVVKIIEFVFKVGFGEFLMVEIVILRVLGLAEFLDISSERVSGGFGMMFGRSECKLLDGGHGLELHVREREKEKDG